MTPETREKLARAIGLNERDELMIEIGLHYVLRSPPSVTTDAIAPILERLVAERVVAETERRAGAERYAATVLHDLSEAKREITTLRDVVVTYGDRVRMAMAASPAMQQVIDRAFDRDN